LSEYQSLASSGGNGSFNFGDTSMYGPRELRSNESTSGRALTPGGGGGAKAKPNAHYGGRAQSITPNGVVIIRLLKIA
jgi:hypothetical protein